MTMLAIRESRIAAGVAQTHQSENSGRVDSESLRERGISHLLRAIISVRWSGEMD
jgi:hypothetical protein